MGYKYVEYKSSCGFPESALVKVRNKLEDNKLSYNIFDKDELKETYKGISNNYVKLLKDAVFYLERAYKFRYISDKACEKKSQELSMIYWMIMVCLLNEK